MVGGYVIRRLRRVESDGSTLHRILRQSASRSTQRVGLRAQDAIVSGTAESPSWGPVSLGGGTVASLLMGTAESRFAPMFSRYLPDVGACRAPRRCERRYGMPVIGIVAKTLLYRPR